MSKEDIEFWNKRYSKEEYYGINPTYYLLEKKDYLESFKGKDCLCIAGKFKFF
jgi:hypothetical protein